MNGQRANRSYMYRRHGRSCIDRGNDRSCIDRGKAGHIEVESQTGHAWSGAKACMGSTIIYIESITIYEYAVSKEGEQNHVWVGSEQVRRTQSCMSR